MSIQVENSLKDADKEIFEQRTHFIPCNLEDDGSANVNKYFEPYIIDNGEGDLTATFRGHALDGTNMTIPKGYRGILVTEAKRPLAENAERKFQIVGGFKEFVYWNWDKKPSKNDNLVKALDWVDISEAVNTWRLKFTYILITTRLRSQGFEFPNYVKIYKLLPFDRIQRRVAGIVGDQALSDQLDPLALRRDVGSLCIFYRIYHGECSEGLF